jgi:hypothetical protein
MLTILRVINHHRLATSRVIGTTLRSTINKDSFKIIYVLVDFCVSKLNNPDSFSQLISVHQ